MQQFLKGQVTKDYLCIVDGVLSKPVGSDFSINAPIQQHDFSVMRQVGDSKSNSKHALTKYTVLDKSTPANMTLLRATPKTGRTHQIRVHAAFYGNPIIGDSLYNPKEYVFSYTHALPFHLSEYHPSQNSH